MARGGRPGDDDPGALLFGDDDYDDEQQDEDENKLKPEPKQGSLWGDHAQDDEERAPTQPIASPVEDLRYQGPISMDDADEPEEGYEDPGPGTGRVFFAAALIGGVIITMFAVALYYRGSSDDLVASTVAKTASERRPAASAPLTQSPPAPAPSQTPAANTAPAGSTASNAASTGSPTIEYRPVSEAPATSGPERPSGVASVKPPVALATGAGASTAQERLRPAPVVASHVTPAKPAEASHPSTHSSGTSSLDEIARRGRNRLEAAPAGSWTVQVIVACQPVTVEKAFRNVESTNLVAIPVDLKGQSCYRLCWGLYSDRAAAERAITSVPNYFAQGTKPQPVPVTKVVGH